eukprot:1183068-Rhodomonas_salina.1
MESRPGTPPWRGGEKSNMPQHCQQDRGTACRRWSLGLWLAFTTNTIGTTVFPSQAMMNTFVLRHQKISYPGTRVQSKSDIKRQAHLAPFLFKSPSFGGYITERSLLWRRLQCASREGSLFGRIHAGGRNAHETHRSIRHSGIAFATRNETVRSGIPKMVTDQATAAKDGDQGAKMQAGSMSVTAAA